jgi:hypothetical protein
MRHLTERAQRFRQRAFRSHHGVNAQRRRSYLYVLALIISLGLTLITGCRNKGVQGSAQFEQDAEAVAQVQRIAPQDMTLLTF